MQCAGGAGAGRRGGARERRWRGALALLLLLPTASCSAQTRTPAAVAVRDTFPPFARAPVDPPLRVTATFGEFRTGHFHAGLDFSTESETGHPVYSPIEGWVERVRTSGSGYGRSLMITGADRRTILFGHLDAFEEPLAAYVDSAQSVEGQYEQDLSPPPGRFPVHAGQRVAWSGSSGVGPPHLHMELRRDDRAYNPLRFGLPIPDSLPPSLSRVVLQPADTSSWVSRTARPRSFAFVGRPDTVLVEGRVRPWALAVDPGVTGSRLAPWAAEMTWNGATVSCRFDTLVWDADMTAAEWVYDGTGRVGGGHPIALSFGPEYRARVYDSSAGGAEGGVIEVRPGDPARPLRVAVSDAAGHRVEHEMFLRGPTDAERGAAPVKVVARPPEGVPLEVRAEAGARTGEEWRPFSWSLPPRGAFASVTLRVRPPRAAVAVAGLAPVSQEYAVLPATLPLRLAADVAIELPPSVSDPRRVGLYVDSGRGWRHVVSGPDSTGRAVRGPARALGKFALFADVSAPVVLPFRTKWMPGPAVPYSRWAMEAGVRELGSGLDTRATRFLVDGRPTAIEFDPDEARMRWRPRAKPAAGRHAYELTLVDRAGNTTRRSGSFLVR